MYVFYIQSLIFRIAHHTGIIISPFCRAGNLSTQAKATQPDSIPSLHSFLLLMASFISVIVPASSRYSSCINPVIFPTYFYFIFTSFTFASSLQIQASPGPYLLRGTSPQGPGRAQMTPMRHLYFSISWAPRWGWGEA